MSIPCWSRPADSLAALATGSRFLARDREDTVAIHPPAPIVDTLGAGRWQEWRQRMQHPYTEVTGWYPPHLCGPTCPTTFTEIPGPVRLGRDSSDARPAGLAVYPRGRG